MLKIAFILIYAFVLQEIAYRLIPADDHIRMGRRLNKIFGL